MTKGTKPAARVEAMEETAALSADLDALKRSLEGERSRSEDYLNRLRYLQADFENYRKRMDREVRDLEEFSTVSLVRKLLSVLDDLDLAITTSETAKGGSNGLIEGVKMIKKNLSSALEMEGLRRIDALGKPFNPQLHEAVEKIAGGNDGGGKEGSASSSRGGDIIVVDVVRPGYTFKGKVLRPSAVRVTVGGQSKERGEEVSTTTNAEKEHPGDPAGSEVP